VFVLGGTECCCSLQQAAACWTGLHGRCCHAARRALQHCVATRLLGANDTAGYLTGQASKSTCVCVSEWVEGSQAVTHD